MYKPTSTGEEFRKNSQDCEANGYTALT